MARSLKILIGLLIALLIILAALFLALPTMINDFKPDIEKAAKEQTGLLLRLNGDIGLSLFPVFGISIADVDLTQPDGQPFAAADDLRLAVAIIPLFSGQLQVDKVVLDGVSVNLVRDASGQANWDIIRQTQEARSAGKRSPSTQTDESDQPSGELTENNDNPEATGPKALPELAFALIRISNTRVDFRDDQKGQAIRLEDFNLNISDFRFDDWFPISLSYRLNNKAPELRLEQSLETDLKISRDLQVFGIQQLESRLLAEGQPTRGKTLELALSGELEADLPKGHIQIPEFKLSLDDTHLELQSTIDLNTPQIELALRGDQLDLTRYLPATPAKSADSTPAARPGAKATTASASASGETEQATDHPFKALRQLNLDATVQFGKLVLPGQVLENIDLAFTGKNGILNLSRSSLTLNGEPLRASLKVDANQPTIDSLRLTAGFQGLKLDVALNTLLSFEPARERAQLKDLDLKLNNLRVSGNPGLEDFSAPRFFGELKAPAFSLKQLMASLAIPAPETAKPEAMNQVAFSTRLGGEPNILKLQDMQLQLDQTRFKGQASVDLKTQALTATLAGDRIVADDYLPPPRPESEEADMPIPVPETAGKDSNRDPNTPLLPLDALRKLDADLRFSLQELVFKDYQTRNMDIRLLAKQGLIQLERANADLYDGTLRTVASLDARTDQPLWNLDMKLANVNADKFPKSLTRQEFLFGLLKIQPQGKINLNADYASNGNTLDAVINNARASMDLYLEKGALEELKTLTTFYRLASSFNSSIADTSTLVAATPFKDLKTDFTLEGSKLRQNAYSLQLNRDADIEGSGNIDLLQRTLKYDFRLKPTQVFVQKGNKWATALMDIPLNYTCTADLKVSPVPDCGVDEEAIQEAARAHAEAELRARASRKLDSLIEERLGTDSTVPEGEKSEKEKQRDALKQAGEQLLKGLFR